MSGGHGKDKNEGKGHGESHGEHSEDHEEQEGHSEEGHGEHGEEHAHEEAHGGDGHGSHAEHNEEKPHKPAMKTTQQKKKTIGEIGVLTLIIIAVVARVFLKEFDALYSIEPIIPIAVYAGLAYGTDAGVLVGLLSYPLSNIFLEGGAFGLWSFLQGIGGAIAGWLAGNARSITKSALLNYSILGTLIFF